MNTMGLNLIFQMGCLCSKEAVYVKSDKYYIVEKIGEGGFSTVSLIEHSRTKKRYALKKIICHGREDQAQAIREVEHHKTFVHPNILPLLDHALTGCADPVLNSTSQVLMVLPYYPKGTLANDLELRSVGKHYMSSVDILKMFLKICEAVKVFHDAKPIAYAHRDLKTANVLLANDNNPLLMDLGSVAPAVVKVCGSAEAQNLQDVAAERCSMPYRAPELFHVDSYCVVDQRTDVWSLGCLLYAMCYFKSPFDTVYERGDSVALAVISGNITFPENTPFPQELHDLILFMLKVTPSERPFIHSVCDNAQDLLSRLSNREEPNV
ncbi:hypothetical protein M8J76_010670 [Diaphorina citri]|nr:hypothetical protein M8J75_009777 [Diaphorina citri]KAI5749844.1 hypothetical protein M8J76_010670 [Diaphorina citri]KAI5755136.1 hypothetical protein M8J77_014395 [Diaphorina citri]